MNDLKELLERADAALQADDDVPADTPPADTAPAFDVAGFMAQRAAERQNARARLKDQGVKDAPAPQTDDEINAAYNARIGALQAHLEGLRATGRPGISAERAAVERAIINTETERKSALALAEQRRHAEQETIAHDAVLAAHMLREATTREERLKISQVRGWLENASDQALFLADPTNDMDVYGDRPKDRPTESQRRAAWREAKERAATALYGAADGTTYREDGIFAAVVNGRLHLMLDNAHLPERRRR